jgi:hypothetical protein
MGRGNTSKTTKLWCPCCGYDLSALPPTWTSTCPTQGICSECGEHFPWSDIFHPENARTLWLYEYAPHWWCFKSLVKTYLVALVPPMLLRRLRFEKHVRWLSFMFLFAIVPYVFVASNPLSELLVAYSKSSYFAAQGWGPAKLPEIESYIRAITFPLFYYNNDTYSSQWGKGWLIDPFFRDYILASLAFAGSMSFHILGYKIPNIPKHHLARLFLYSLVPASGLLFLKAILISLYNLVSALFYLINTNSPVRWSRGLTSDLLNFIDIARESTIPQFFALLWLAWFWAIVYRKHLKLVRWKYFYLTGLLVALIFYFLFRGILAPPF